jgi:hypothetical protein
MTVELRKRRTLYHASHTICTSNRYGFREFPHVNDDTSPVRLNEPAGLRTDIRFILTRSYPVRHEQHE